MIEGICYGVSVGPGDVNLITLEAIEVIEKSDIIFLPSFPKEDCRAYQIIKKTYPKIDEKELRAETFTMSRDASVMKNRHQEIFENICPLLDDGKCIAFLTLGEVALYSTYLYIHEKLLSNGYKSLLVNGISSVQAISAKLNIPLAIGSQQLHIYPDSSSLEYKLVQPGTKVFMKPKGSLEDFILKIQEFIEKNPYYKAAGISNCGMENQIIAANAKELTKLQGYFTVIIVTGDDPAYEPTAAYFENRSCEYYPCHKGEDHLNCLFCYCPMYRFDNCLGNPTYKTKADGKVIKVCTNCTFPHVKSNYSDVVDFLKNQ